ncbi:hypothetical protein [Nonomuraea glycinis]|uniref:hypothetical protein n=1 Tax=Nonomuraea glycinis TaxID=2047744 RepID=UPI002E15219D|nr:hypothetical protein OHA68_43340 [Nonomuraea glycinis]
MANQTEPVPSLADLKARLLDGDETVTAEQLAHAAELAQWEDLRRQAAELKAAEEAEADRLDRITATGRQLVASFDDDGDAADLDIIRDAVASIAQRADRRKEAFSAAFGALTREGVPVDGQPVAGVTRHLHGMGLGERIVIDGRTVTYIAPGKSVSDAIASGLGDVGKSLGYLSPGLVIAGRRKPRTETPEQAADREARREAARAYIAKQEQAKSDERQAMQAALQARRDKRSKA